VILGTAGEAGLQPTELEYIQYVEEYADVETIARGMLSAPRGRAESRATSAGTGNLIAVHGLDIPAGDAFCAALTA